MNVARRSASPTDEAPQRRATARVRAFAVIGLCVALCLAAHPLHAQAAAGTSRATGLVVDAHMGADRNSGSTSLSQPSGASAGATAMLAHTRAGRRLGVTVTAGSEVRRRPGTDTVSAEAQWATARLRVPLSPRTVVAAEQQLSYTPALSQATAASGPATGPQLLASLRRSSDVTITSTRSRLMSVDAGVRVDWTGFRGTDAHASTQRAEIGATRQLRRWAVLGVRYDGVRAEVVGSGSVTSLTAHDTAAYVTVTPWRAARTTLAITVAPLLAVRTMSATGTTVAPPAPGTSWLLTGRARLERRAARAWNVGLDAERRASYQAGLSEPVLTHAFGASLTGTVGRDVDVAAAAGYSAGSGSDPSARISVLTGRGRVAWRLSPAVSAFVELRHDASSTAASLTHVPGLAGRAHRTVVRLGITTGAGSARRPGSTAR